MHTVGLAAKVYSNAQLQNIENELKSALKGLSIEAKIQGADKRGWVRLSLSGEDEKVAVRYLADKIGLCPSDLNSIHRFSTFKGYMSDPSKNKNAVRVDIGLFSPSNLDVAISLQCLQAQIGDGRKIALSKFIELFGFCDNLPVDIRVTRVDFEKTQAEAELSEKQQKQYGDWTRSLLDRLLIIGVPDFEIERAIGDLQFTRDIVKIEPLGIFEHAVACKLGTDAAGLIPRLGRHLRTAVFSVFSPKRIVDFLGEDAVPTIF